MLSVFMSESFVKILATCNLPRQERTRPKRKGNDNMFKEQESFPSISLSSSIAVRFLVRSISRHWLDFVSAWLIVVRLLSWLLFFSDKVDTLCDHGHVAKACHTNRKAVPHLFKGLMRIGFSPCSAQPGSVSVGVLLVEAQICGRFDVEVEHRVRPAEYKHPMTCQSLTSELSKIFGPRLWNTNVALRTVIIGFIHHRWDVTDLWQVMTVLCATWPFKTLGPDL